MVNLLLFPAQPVSLRAMLDVHGNFAPDQTKMVQQADGAYVEATTPDPVSKKAWSAMEVARGYSMYWVAHLVTSIRHTTLHSKYASRTTSTTGLWLHPYYVAKFQTVLWRVVDRVSGDTLDGILTTLLQYVQERTNTADEDAWTGEAAVEYVCAKLSEQVSFAAAMTGKRKADAPQGGKPQKSSTGRYPCHMHGVQEEQDDARFQGLSRVCTGEESRERTGGSSGRSRRRSGSTCSGALIPHGCGWVGERNLVPRLLAGAEAGRAPRACLRDLRCHERARQGTVGPSLQLCLYETRVVNS